MYPRFLEIEITGRCPYRCMHCYGNFPTDGQLETDAVMKVLAEARGLFDCVIFSGGEPLLHSGLADMVAAASRDFAVFITTSGYGLTEKLLARLKDKAVLVFGMDGIGATHDYYRGRPGAFSLLVECLDMTRHLPKEIIVTLWRKSIAEIDLIVDFARACSTVLHFNGLIPVGRVRDNPEIMPDSSSLAHADKKLHTLKDLTGWIVTDLHRVTEADRTTGINLFCKGRYNITPQGDVRPCEFHHVVFGNIHEQSLADIIAAAKRTELIRSREEGFIGHVRTDLENPYDYHTTICHKLRAGLQCGALEVAYGACF